MPPSRRRHEAAARVGEAIVTREATHDLDRRGVEHGARRWPRRAWLDARMRRGAGRYSSGHEPPPRDWPGAVRCQHCGRSPRRCRSASVDAAVVGVVAAEAVAARAASAAASAGIGCRRARSEATAPAGSSAAAAARGRGGHVDEPDGGHGRNSRVGGALAMRWTVAQSAPHTWRRRWRLLPAQNLRHLALLTLGEPCRAG